MKRFVLIFLSVLLCISIFSCESDNITSSSEVTSSESISSVEDTSSEEVSEPDINADVKISDIEFLDSLAFNTWETGDDIESHNIVYLFNKFSFATMTQKERDEKYTLENMQGGFYFPAEELEAFAQKYFDVSVEHLRNTPTYLSEYNVYSLGAGSNLRPQVEFSQDDVKFDGEVYTVTAKLTHANDVEYKIFTLKKDGDHFKYLSCVQFDNTVNSSIHDVLLGTKNFKYVGQQYIWGNEEEVSESILNISEVPEFFNPHDSYMEIQTYAIVDLNGDDQKEAVLHVCGIAGDMSKYLVLHEINGTVYGYSVDYRYFENLKTDGTFNYSSPVATTIATVSVTFDEKNMFFKKIISADKESLENRNYTYTINGKTVTKEEYDTAYKEQEKKYEVNWQDFADYKNNNHKSDWQIKDVKTGTIFGKGFTKIDMGEFYWWLPENTSDPSSVKYKWLYNYGIYGNKICYDKSENSVVIEVVSIERVENKDNPFLKYDELYSNADNFEHYKFGLFSAKRYHIQKTDSDFERYVYSIKVDDEMLVINFYPLFNIDEFSSQAEEFEPILNSIIMK